MKIKQNIFFLFLLCAGANIQAQHLPKISRCLYDTTANNLTIWGSHLSGPFAILIENKKTGEVVDFANIDKANKTNSLITVQFYEDGETWRALKGDSCQADLLISLDLRPAGKIIAKRIPHIELGEAKYGSANNKSHAIEKPVKSHPKQGKKQSQPQP